MRLPRVYQRGGIGLRQTFGGYVGVVEGRIVLLRREGSGWKAVVQGNSEIFAHGQNLAYAVLALKDRIKQ